MKLSLEGSAGELQEEGLQDGQEGSWAQSRLRVCAREGEVLQDKCSAKQGGAIAHSGGVDGHE